MQLQKRVLVCGDKTVTLYGENHSPQRRCSRKSVVDYILGCVNTQVYLEMPMNFTVDAATRPNLLCDSCNGDVLNALRTCVVMKGMKNVVYSDPRELLGTLPFTKEERDFVERQQTNWNADAVVDRFLLPLITAGQLRNDFPALLHAEQQLIDKRQVFGIFNAQSRVIWEQQTFTERMIAAISSQNIHPCVQLYRDATDLMFELVVFSMIMESHQQRHLFYGGRAHSHTLTLLLQMCGFE